PCVHWALKALYSPSSGCVTTSLLWLKITPHRPGPPWSARPPGHAAPPEVRAPRSGKRSRPSPSRPRRPSRTAFADSSHTHMSSLRPRPNAPHLHFEHALHTVVDAWSVRCRTPNNSSALEL